MFGTVLTARYCRAAKSHEQVNKKQQVFAWSKLEGTVTNSGMIFTLCEDEPQELFTHLYLTKRLRDDF